MKKLPTCPNCGGTNILISYEKEDEPNYYAVFFALFYLIWLVIRIIIGLFIFLFYDLWRAIAEKKRGKRHSPRSKRWFFGSKRSYYCEDCKTHFKE